MCREFWKKLEFKCYINMYVWIRLMKTRNQNVLCMCEFAWWKLGIKMCYVYANSRRNSNQRLWCFLSHAWFLPIGRTICMGKWKMMIFFGDETRICEEKKLLAKFNKTYRWDTMEWPPRKGPRISGGRGHTYLSRKKTKKITRNKTKERPLELQIISFGITLASKSSSSFFGYGYIFLPNFW